MSNFIKKLFGTLTEKSWERERAAIDDAHEGKTFDLSVQTSAVIIILGIATALFSLIFTGYIYSIPPEQDTRYLLKPNFLWLNTFILFCVTFFFSKVNKDLEKKITHNIKKKANQTINKYVQYKDSADIFFSSSKIFSFLNLRTLDETFPQKNSPPKRCNPCNAVKI